MFNKNIHLPVLFFLKKKRRKEEKSLIPSTERLSVNSYVSLFLLLVQDYLSIWDEKYPAGFPSKPTFVSVKRTEATFFWRHSTTF